MSTSTITTAIAMALTAAAAASVPSITQIDAIDNGVGATGIGATGVRVTNGSLFQHVNGHDKAEDFSAAALAADASLQFDSFVGFDGGAAPVFGQSANPLYHVYQFINPSKGIFTSDGSNFEDNAWFSIQPGFPLLDTLNNGRPELFFARVTVTDGATLTGDIAVGNVNVDGVNMGNLVVEVGKKTQLGDVFLEFLVLEVDNTAGGVALDGYTTYDLVLQQNPTPGAAGLALIAGLAATRRRR